VRGSAIIGDVVAADGIEDYVYDIGTIVVTP
jgi:hypothetical protein